MGLLQHDSGATHLLAPRNRIGRAPSCELHIADRTVSGEHATIQWRKSTWYIRDLGSRNGTFVNDKRIEPGASHALVQGMRLTFGSTEAWTLTDAGAPRALAISADGRQLRADGDLIAIPSAEQPEVILYADSQGTWWQEQADSRLPVRGPITACGTTWTLMTPAGLAGTATVGAGKRLDAVRLVFTVSRDEERVGLTVIHRGRAKALAARAHLYVLLTLARLRLEDHNEPSSEQGWVDRETLQRMLGMDSNALNVAIHRARKQIAKAGFEGAANIVEVRRGHRRFGVEPGRVTVETP